MPVHLLREELSVRRQRAEPLPASVIAIASEACDVSRCATTSNASVQVLDDAKRSIVTCSMWHLVVCALRAREYGRDSLGATVAYVLNHTLGTTNDTSIALTIAGKSARRWCSQTGSPLSFTTSCSTNIYTDSTQAASESSWGAY